MLAGGRKRCQEPFRGPLPSLLGRPRGRNVTSRPNRSAVRRTHASEPKGCPRVTHRRSASSSALVCGSFTQSTHRDGRGIGHSAKQRRFTAAPAFRHHRLDHRHSSALTTNPALKGFRSTYRHTARKCSSPCTGNALNRPWYTCPWPVVLRCACQRCVCVSVTHARNRERSPSRRGHSIRCQ